MEAVKVKRPILETLYMATFWVVAMAAAISAVGLFLNQNQATQAPLVVSPECMLWFGGVFLTHVFIYFHDVYMLRKQKFGFWFNLCCCVPFVIMGILLMVLRDRPIVAGVAAIVYSAVLLARRIYPCVTLKNRRMVIFQIVLSGAFLVLLVCACIMVTSPGFSLIAVPIFEVAFALASICILAFKRMQAGVLLRIIRKTYAAEVFIGLLSMIVAFSVALTFFDEFNSFGDAMWYCFAVVTTIGFGDFTAVTAIGRFMSVILGIYGIVTVAVITSIIVSFYNEVKDSSDDGAKSLPKEEEKAPTEETKEE